MGQDIKNCQFTPSDFTHFRELVQRELETLKEVLQMPGFGQGSASVGAELEYYIVDEEGHASGINHHLLESCKGKGMQAELNRFNIEHNLLPQPLTGTPFALLESEMGSQWLRLNELAAQHKARLVPIGILPTLRKSDFGPHSMTNQPRYVALAEGLRQMRGKPFEVSIHGRESLEICTDDVTLEGANTSFQFHWRVAPELFVATYNAVQLLTPLYVALNANSPFLLYHDLWDETRIALFKQSVDVRAESGDCWRSPARVDFGQGWLRTSPVELFEQAVALYPPLLPSICEETGLSEGNRQKLPPLNNLKLHQGTTWAWNRAIYDSSQNGHLRIELRAMPAGPTIKDMLATAAFTIGCAQQLTDHVNTMITQLPFKYAEHNFYTAAKKSLSASLIWPDPGQMGLSEKPITDIIAQLLPLAARGLIAMGVDEKEASGLMEIIALRLAKKQNGASWQRSVVHQLERRMDRKSACTEMFSLYRFNQARGLPVAEWKDTP